MTIYIPGNFDFETFEHEHQPQKKTTGYKRDKIAFFLHQLNYIPMYNKRYRVDQELIPLSSKILQKQMGNNYSQYIDCLGQAGIIDTDNSYIVNSKHKSYRIAQPYASSVKPYQLNDFSLHKKLSSFYLDKQKSSRKYEYLKKWFRGLEINQQAAEDFILEDHIIKTQCPRLRDRNDDGALISPYAQYKLGQIAIDKFINKDFDFTVDPSGYRFHSMLSNTRSSLRNALTYGGKPLVSLDIKNSQPFFSTMLFKKDFWEKATHEARFKKLFNHILSNNIRYSPSIMFSKITECMDGTDIQRYMHLVSTGEFYDYYTDQYNQKHRTQFTRAEIKTELFAVLFSQNKTRNSFKSFFTELFPGVDHMFRFIKSKQHNTLALLLQRIESEVVLDDICEIITHQYKDMPLFTIHDSIATTEDYLPVLKHLMEARIENYTGYKPILKPEYWRIENLDKELSELKARI